MKRRNKILVVVVVLTGLFSIIGVSLGYYLMSRFSILGWAVGNNPFEALRVAGKMMVNELIQTPVKGFDLEKADLNYNQTVIFPEDKFELVSAEQIIEWSVKHNSQPWVEDVGKFLSEADYSLIDTTAHFIFIECMSGNNPVMTITYYSGNNSLLVEKGWVDRVTQNSYTLIATEALALEIIKLNSDYRLIVKTIIENLNNTIKFLQE